MKPFISSARSLFCVCCYLLVSACSSPNGGNYRQIASANHNDRVRYLVLHHTAIDYQKSLAALTEPDRVSAHYLIPERDDPSYQGKALEVQQLVKESDRAWHAGYSYWQGKSGLNDVSIGIELVQQAPCLRDENQDIPNLGLNSHVLNNSVCFYPDYDAQQIELLIPLIKGILKRHPEITPTRIMGHADIAPSRRVDPGPRFPWHRLYKEGIGAWYETETLSRYHQLFSAKPPSLGLLQSALNAYGYSIIETGVLDPQTINVLSVFQMHFRPWEVTGQADVRTSATVFALLERYFPEANQALLAQHQREFDASLITDLAEPKGQRNLILKTAKRQAVNFKAQFKAMANKGSVILNSDIPVTFDLRINGRLIQEGIQLEPDIELPISIASASRQGTNYIALSQISDEHAEITARIDYPQLINPLPSTASPSFAQVDALIEKDIAAGFSGAVLAVVKGGQLIKHQAYGYSSRYQSTGEMLSDPEAMKVDTLFDLASNTKMYATNYALMKLATEGRLDVTQPIQFYLEEYQGQGREQRLVKDLLNHTAGYEPSTAFYNQEKVGERLFSQNPVRTKQLLTTQLGFRNGRNLKTIYSDNDYLLLGLLIERITGMPLDQYVETQIYGPLGLTNTRFNPLQKGFDAKSCAATELAGNSRGGRVSFENIRQEVIRCEVHDEKAFYSMHGVAGHAGLFSTAEEVAKLAMVTLNRGGYGSTDLFSADVMDQFTKPSDKDITTGLGWRRAGNGDRLWQFGPYASPYAFGHTGWTGTVTVIDPMHDLIIVLLTNKKHSPIDETEDGLKFLGDTLETGKYGSVIALIYEAVLGTGTH